MNMYTSEFIEKVEALPFVGEIEKGFNTLGFPDAKTNKAIFAVEENKYLTVNTKFPSFEILSEDEKDKLMNLVWQYISTPVDKRNPEKKFELKPKSEFKTLFGDDKLRLPIFGGIRIRFTNSELEKLFTDEQLEWIEMTFDKEWIE